MVTGRDKTTLQKLSSICSLLFFISSGICVFILAMFFGDLSKVYAASFASSGFFFFTAAIVLKEMADTNLPKLRDNKSTGE